MQPGWPHHKHERPLMAAPQTPAAFDGRTANTASVPESRSVI